MFATNVGTIDRVVRIVVGAVLLVMFFTMPDSPWRRAFLIGLVPLATGIFSTCPAYSLFGISTCPAKKA